MENQEYEKRTNELLAELAKYPENSQEYRDIVAKIVKNCGGLVGFAAKKYSPMLKWTALNSDDLIADGYLGLLKAIKLFNKEKGVSFATFAMHVMSTNIRNHLSKETRHITYSLEDDKDGDNRKLKDDLVSPVNIEKDFAEKDETNRQMAWVRKNLDHLKPLQKQVLISKYLSGEASLVGNALAKKFNCTRQSIFFVENRAINKLRKMYDETHPGEIELTRKDNSTKLSTLCNSVQGSQHLKSNLECRTEESGKEY